MAITITPAAADHIRRHLDKRGHGLGLRLGVKSTGCSGMAYQVEFVDQATDDDQRFEENGVCVFVASDSLPYLQGTQLDYAREGLNEGFRFRNPNEKAACGCGESFTV